MNTAAVELASRLRQVTTRHSAEYSGRDDVSGAGVAWREGRLKFVVQTDSPEKAERLRSRLPDLVEELPVTLELASLPKAAFMSEPAPRRRTLADRLIKWIRIHF